MAEYFDCVIKAGYYKLFGQQVGEHTFAIAERNGVQYAFPCFGCFARQEREHGQTGVVYPAELWTPYMLFSRSQGKSLKANLHVALGMAQRRLEPRTDYRVEDWDNWWNQLPEQLRYLSPSCNAGLVYAVTGVCQQACNRILWSSQQDAFTHTPVNWPPSFSASYWVYGYYGKLSEPEAIWLATELVKEAKRRASRILYAASAEVTSAATQALEQAEREAGEVSLRRTREALVAGTPGEERQEEVKKMLEAAPGGKEVVASKKLEGVLAPDEKFHQIKAESTSNSCAGRSRMTSMRIA